MEKSRSSLDNIRQEILAKAIELSPSLGWNDDLIKIASLKAGHQEATALIAFDNGAIDCLKYFARKADEQMLEKLQGQKFLQMKIREKIAFTLKTRFSQQYKNKAAIKEIVKFLLCLLYTSPSPRDLSTSRMPSSA